MGTLHDSTSALGCACKVYAPVSRNGIESDLDVHERSSASSAMYFMLLYPSVLVFVEICGEVLDCDTDDSGDG